ncbi:MAG: Do family serine endopeptidase [Bacteroidales bacterium]
MKKFLSLLMVAMLGGVGALLMERYVFPDKSSQTHIRTFEEGGFSIPSAFTHYLSNVPTTLPDFTLVAEMSVNTVVHIRAEFERPSTIYEEFFGPDIFRDFFGPRQRRSPDRRIQGSGSGVIISHDGYIITNNHVVQDAVKIEVTLNDNTTHDATVIGLDPTTDLAVLRIEGTNFPYAVFGDSDKVKVGEWVLAVGNPFNLTSTVTAGIVSAKGRQINILGGNTAIESFIQTDAAVNRGNSGGALVNTAGELIGINAAIASTTGTFAGYSFAIPSNIAKKVAMDLIQHGEVQRGFLGIEIREVNSQLVREQNLNVNRGVWVAGVSDDGAGKEAGLREGDVITAVNGRATPTTSALLESVGRQRPGDEITITFNRNGRTMEGKAVLRNIHGDTSIVQRGERDVVELLGATLENPSTRELNRLGLRSGVRVASLQQGRLANAGIREGFIITHVDRQPVTNARELVATLSGKSGGVLIEGVYPNGTRAFYGVGM